MSAEVFPRYDQNGVLKTYGTARKRVWGAQEAGAQAVICGAVRCSGWLGPLVSACLSGCLVMVWWNASLRARFFWWHAENARGATRSTSRCDATG